VSYRTRFAPSPTGPLHLGHAYSVLIAQARAKQENGAFLLRIEDIDTSRARDHWEAQIYDDLRWLGIRWEEPVLRQSDNMPAYGAALEQLWQAGLLYPCTCNRRDILAAASAPQEGAPSLGPDGLIYPGTCRPRDSQNLGPMPHDVALRLDVARAALQLPPVICFLNAEAPHATYALKTMTLDAFQTRIGDIVVARRDMGTSYHLSVVVDDAAQSVTEVIRGADLLDATFIHVVLQRLLDLPTPSYLHHQLIRDNAGKRLAKRDDARAIAKYRAEGATPADIRRMVGLSA
jgi:glutamyl-Q tRNA(Asp) synthetase